MTADAAPPLVVPRRDRGTYQPGPPLLVTARPRADGQWPGTSLSALRPLTARSSRAMTWRSGCRTSPQPPDPGGERRQHLADDRGRRLVGQRAVGRELLRRLADEDLGPVQQPGVEEDEALTELVLRPRPA